MDRMRELFTKNRNGKLLALAFVLAGSFLHFKPDPWRDNTSMTPGVLTSQPIRHMGSGTRRFSSSYYKFSYSYLVNGVHYSGHGRTSTEPHSFTVYYQTSNPSESRLEATNDAEKFDGLLVVVGIMLFLFFLKAKRVPPGYPHSSSSAR